MATSHTSMERTTQEDRKPMNQELENFRAMIGRHLNSFYQTLDARIERETKKLESSQGLTPKQAILLLEAIRDAYQNNFRQYWEKKG